MLEFYFHATPNSMKVALLLEEIGGRPAAAQAMALKGRHATSTEMNADARKAMFPQNA